MTGRMKAVCRPKRADGGIEAAKAGSERCGNSPIRRKAARLNRNAGRSPRTLANVRMPARRSVGMSRRLLFCRTATVRMSDEKRAVRAATRSGR